MPTPAASPPPSPDPHAVAPEERIAALDAIRGVALAGVLVANLVFAFRISPTAWYVPGAIDSQGLDAAADALVRTVVQGKALALFSMLFGAGLAIQHERFARHGPPRPRLARRLLVLLGFGLVHLLLVWNGDILVEYALAGLLLLPWIDAPPRRLARVALALFAFYMLSPLLPFLPPWPDDATLRRELARATAIYATGSWSEIRRYGVHEWLVFLPVYVGLFASTPLLFIAGLLAWRTGLLRDARTHRRPLLAIAAVGLGVGAPLTLVSAREDLAGASLLAAMLAALAPPLLAAGYGAAMRLAYDTAAGRRVLAPFVAPGRMAFTNYIVQSLAFGFVFFGYGLGLMGRLGSAATLAFGLAFFALQAAASAWWLRRFRFGPLEWAWRSLTYGRVQPM